MPTNDHDCAQAVADLYWHPEKLDSIIDLEGVCIGVRNFDDATIICFRGSTTPQDWFRDFQAQMIYHPELGGVEAGFVQGVRAALLRCDVRNPINPLWIVGHSLGAARALVAAALLASEGLMLPEDQVVTFGSPRPGAQKIKDLLANVPIRSYKNLRDPVCDVPFDIPLIDPYVHPRDLIHVDAAPADDDPWGIVSDHHAELYLKAMQNAFPASPAAP